MSYKCVINDKNEIEGFYEDVSKAPLTHGAEAKPL